MFQCPSCKLVAAAKLPRDARSNYVPFLLLSEHSAPVPAFLWLLLHALNADHIDTAGLPMPCSAAVQVHCLMLTSMSGSLVLSAPTFE